MIINEYHHHGKKKIELYLNFYELCEVVFEFDFELAQIYELGKF